MAVGAKDVAGAFDERELSRRIFSLHDGAERIWRRFNGLIEARCAEHFYLVRILGAPRAIGRLDSRDIAGTPVPHGGR